MAKVISVMVVVVVLSSLLGGCTEKFASGPNAISLSPEGLRVAVCQDIDVREIYGETEGADGKTVFFDLAGVAKLEQGTIIKAGAGVQGLDGHSSEPPTADISSLGLKFEGVGVGASWSSIFAGDFPLEIPTQGWLQTSGEVTNDPCP